MTYLEILALIVSGAGTLASILGIFFAVYFKHERQWLREFSKEHKRRRWKNSQQSL